MRADSKKSVSKHDTSTSLVLRNGLELLSLVAKTSGQLSLRELGRKLGLSPAVTHRLVTTLTENNFLERSVVTGKYVIGIESFMVGRSYVASTGAEAVAKPILEEAANRYDVNSFMGVRKGTSIVYLLDFSGARRTNIRIAPGTEMPLHATSMGLAILAKLTQQELDEFIEQVAKENDGGSPLLGEEFRKQIRIAQENGYALLASDVFPGVISVGAIVTAQDQLPYAAISFGVSNRLVSKSEMSILGERILMTVERIQFQLSKFL